MICVFFFIRKFVILIFFFMNVVCKVNLVRLLFYFWELKIRLIKFWLVLVSFVINCRMLFLIGVLFVISNLVSE